MKFLAVILLSVAICEGVVYRRDNRPVEDIFKHEPVNRDVESLLDRVFQDEEYRPYKDDSFVFNRVSEDQYKPYRDEVLSKYDYGKVPTKENKAEEIDRPESEKDFLVQLREIDELKKQERKPLKEMEKIERKLPSSMQEDIDRLKLESKPLEEIEKMEKSIVKDEIPTLKQHLSMKTIVEQEFSEKNHANISRLFPTGKMLFNLILEQYPWYRTLIKDEIKEFDGLDETFLKEILQSVTEIVKTVRDPMTLAVVYTKVVLKKIVDERLKCPSAVLDKLLMRRAKETLKVLLVENYNKNSEYLKRYLVNVVDGKEAEKLAKTGALDMDDEVFYNVLHFIASRQLEDVEHVSHKLFTKLLKFFERYPKTDLEDIVVIIQTSIDKCGVKCPPPNVQQEVSKYVAWEISRPFIQMAAQSLAFRVEKMLYRQIYFGYSSKGEEIPSRIYAYISREMHPVVIGLAEKFYKDSTRTVKDYEQVVISGKTLPYLRYIQSFIKPDERDVVVYALKKLGWQVPETQSYEHIDKRDTL